MEKINLAEEVYLPSVADGRVNYTISAQKINQGSGILLYNDDGRGTREFFIKKIAENLLPFFQKNNIHHGLRVMQQGTYLQECPSYRAHADNVIAMNNVIDLILEGKTIINYEISPMGGDQII